MDRASFIAVVRGFSNPPFLISGNGSHAQPWMLRTLATDFRTDARHTPVRIALGDDVEGVFQSSPPSPIDLAVILTNIQRLGAKTAATGAVLAWDAPDPIGLAALDGAIARFDSLVMAAPLTRGAVPESMPPAFRRASFPVAEIRGDASSLPVVNRIPIPGVILGQENTLAGFQRLESEPTTERVPLLARWEDRVVCSFSLLAVLQHLNLPIAGLQIHPGEFLKLSPSGPTVPIDLYGRLAIPLKPLSLPHALPAEALIDAESGMFPKSTPGPVILCDHRSAAEPATRQFSELLPVVIATIASEGGLTAGQHFWRLPRQWEITVLALLCLTLAVCSWLPAFPRNVGFLLILGFCLAAQFLAVGIAHVWLPGLPALAALLGAFALGGSGGAAEAKEALLYEIRMKPPPSEHVPENPPPPKPAKPARKRGKTHRP